LVPDLHHIKSFSDHFKCYILIFANGPHLHNKERTGKEQVAMVAEIVTAVGVLHLELLAYQISIVSASN